MFPVTDIRLSVISGDEKHVAVHVSEAQAVKSKVRVGLFADIVTFAESILALHEDTDKVEIGWDEKAQTVTISPDDTAYEVSQALSASSAAPDAKLVDEVKAQYKTIADLQAQVAVAKTASDAKDKTIADLQAQVDKLTPKP